MRITVGQLEERAQVVTLLLVTLQRMLVNAEVAPVGDVLSTVVEVRAARYDRPREGVRAALVPDEYETEMEEPRLGEVPRRRLTVAALAKLRDFAVSVCGGVPPAFPEGVETLDLFRSGA